MKAAAFALLVVLASGAARAEEVAPAGGAPVLRCPNEPGEGAKITRGFGALAGGMTGTGWDGAGQNATTVNWHMRNTTGDVGAAAQRAAYLAALQTWANVVQITFTELPVGGQSRELDLGFTTGSHCGYEAAECGTAACAFDGVNGTLAHAGFPPGVNSICVPNMPETFAGDVHFDDAETWERDTGSNTAVSLQLIASHELGHAIGLTHDTGAGDIMRPSFSATDSAQAPSASDLANIRAGYANGSGAVITLESLGVWVRSSAAAPELGTFFNPFNTVGEGAIGVPPGSTTVAVHVQAGTYVESVVISQPMFLVAEGGAVRIGTP